MNRALCVETWLNRNAFQIDQQNPALYDLKARRSAAGSPPNAAAMVVTPTIPDDDAVLPRSKIQMTPGERDQQLNSVEIHQYIHDEIADGEIYT